MDKFIFLLSKLTTKLDTVNIKLDEKKAIRTDKMNEKVALNKELLTNEEQQKLLEEKLAILRNPEEFLKHEKSASILTMSVMIFLEGLLGWLISLAAVNYVGVILAIDSLIALGTIFYGFVDIKYMQNYVLKLKAQENYYLDADLENLVAQKEVLRERINELKSEILNVNADITLLESMRDGLVVSIDSIKAERAKLLSVPWELTEEEINNDYNKNDVVARVRKKEGISE